MTQLPESLSTDEKCLSPLIYQGLKLIGSRSQKDRIKSNSEPKLSPEELFDLCFRIRVTLWNSIGHINPIAFSNGKKRSGNLFPPATNRELAALSFLAGANAHNIMMALYSELTATQYSELKVFLAILWDKITSQECPSCYLSAYVESIPTEIYETV